MVAVAQLVRASGCGPEGRRFESDQPPHLEIPEVRVSVSPIFFALKVYFQQKNRQSALRSAVQSMLCIGLSRAPPGLVGGCRRFAPARLRRVAQKIGILATWFFQLL